MRVTSSCDPLNNFYISQATGIQFSPDIAFGGGNYMVIWIDGRAGGTSYRIYGARVTPSGTVLDPSGFQIGASDAGYQYCPSIEYNGTNFLAVWGYFYAPQRIIARFISTSGALSDTVKLADANGYVYKTALAYSGSNYMVAWIEYSAGTYIAKGIILNASGVPITSPFMIASPVYYYSLSLCYDGTQYCVSYITQTGQYMGQKYDLAGTPIGSPFLISPSTNSHYYGEIIPGANNCYLNVWSEYISTQYDIFGNLDINIIGVEEEKQVNPRQDFNMTTIVSGRLQLPANRKCTIYDISGRKVETLNPMPGIYFVYIDGNLAQKVVKVR